MPRIFIVLALFGLTLQAQTGPLVSQRAPSDFFPTADPASAEWKQVPAITAANDSFGSPLPALATEIRTQWTDQNLYILFVCPYRELYTKPYPVTDSETNKLWDWDVAEAFIGSDFDNIDRYKEFEISPHGEWVDLDIDRKHSLPQGGITWDSGFGVATRLDEQNKIWYGEMRIPFKAISPKPPAPGLEFRLNLYRIQGPDRKELAWQPTRSRSFHVPSSFGILKLGAAH